MKRNLLVLIMCALGLFGNLRAQEPITKYYRIKVNSGNQSGSYLHIIGNPTGYTGHGEVGVKAKAEDKKQIFQIEDAGSGYRYLRSYGDNEYIVCRKWNVDADTYTKSALEMYDSGDGSFYLRDPYYVEGKSDNYFKVEWNSEGNNYYVFCDAPNWNSGVVTWILEEVPALEGTKPTNLEVALNNRTATLEWDAVENASSYNVYQNGANIATGITDASYSVNGLSAETEYCFTVEAVNMISVSDMSDAACVTTGAPMLPSVPNLSEISANGTSVTLTWDAAANADSYNVYRDGIKIQTGITGLTFTDNGLAEKTRYCYTVTAVNPDGESDQSNELCAITTKMISGEEEIKEIIGAYSNASSTFSPIYSGNTGKYSMSQQYYTKSEINNNAGNITSISFNVSAASSALTHNLEIYLTNVDDFGFEIGMDFYATCYKVSAGDLVFEGNFTFPMNEGWFEIELNKTFYYKGNHILVTVVSNTPSTRYGIAFTSQLDAVVEEEYCAAYKYDDNMIDPISGNYNVSTSGYRNDIRFSFAGVAPMAEFVNNGNWSAATNWNTGAVPAETDDVVIKADATITSDVKVSTLTIESGSLTIESGSLTVTDILVNNDVNSLVIKDGAQLIQTSDKVKGSMQMNVKNPSEWSESNIEGWQFISSPFTDAVVSQFTEAGDEYDLYKFDGKNLKEEWRNHKALVDFEDVFVSGRGYMASYMTNKTAALSGTFNNSTSIDYPVTYQEIEEGEHHWPNFHLLGNPFTFNMDLSKLQMTNMATGVAVVNSEGGFDYMSTGNINVGDGFFVKATGENPSVYYSGAPTRRSDDATDNINIVLSGNKSRDNVVINFAGADKEGFPKMMNFNDDIATLYISNNAKRYAIFNYDEDVREVTLSFEAPKMGNYTISAVPEGEYESITLVDRLTGIETNMLLGDYNFTATTKQKDNESRFIVRFTKKSNMENETERFAYYSDEEIIVEAEGSVQIVDVTGRIVYSNEVENSSRINVGNLRKGAYILRLFNEEGVKVQKVVIY